LDYGRGNRGTNKFSSLGRVVTGKLADKLSVKLCTGPFADTFDLKFAVPK